MSRLTPLDMGFLLLENSSRQTHMTAYQMFKVPARQKRAWVSRVLDSFRRSEVGPPFNQRLRWLGTNVASWETVEPDLHYHVRHVAVPEPGSMRQFYDLVTFLNTPLLDRNLPLWDCYVIEGIEDNHIAIMIRVHHAMIDGGGALKLFRAAMSDNRNDRTIRPIWSPQGQKTTRKRRRKQDPPLKQLVSSLARMPGGILSTGTEFARMGAQSLGLRSSEGALPFSAPQTLFNNVARSSARRYANCELSLRDVKAIGRQTGTTVNDVVTAIIDDALHRYLGDRGAAIDRPLVSLMAMSVRTDDQGAGGNQVTAELVPMGQPDATITERLQQIHASIAKVKQKSAVLPVTVRQFYSILVFGSSALSDISSAFERIPSANVLISNMAGPREQLYLGGMPMVAFQGLPIVPPGGGLNITFASFSDNICLAIGAAPEAVDDPFKLIRFIEQSFDRLRTATLKKSKAAARNARARS